MKRVPCSGCSLLCDDVLINTDGIFIHEIIGACLKGKERFDQVTAKNRILSPLIRVNGELKKISRDTALKKTIEIIKQSSRPLLYGFSNICCEAQLKGIELAKKINGFIDSNSTICQGQVLEISKEMGTTLTTITEIINKADTLIVWGANIAESIPRLLNKVLFSRGKFRMTGREIRTLLIIDPLKTASFGVMGVRDVALLIDPNKDIDLIKTLKEECCTDNSIPSEGVAGLDRDDLKRFLQNITGSENAVVFIGQGLLNPRKDGDAIKELLELIQMINLTQPKGRISVVMIGGHFNMAGFDHVALSSSGKNHSLQFSDNKLIETNDTILSKIDKEDFDCSIIVGTDPIAHLPSNLARKLASKPLILIDNRSSATSKIADIIFPTSISGIESGGLAYRLDHVPIELKRIINPPNDILSDSEMLSQLLENLSNNTGGE